VRFKRKKLRKPKEETLRLGVFSESLILGLGKGSEISTLE